ncbi:MAG: hypothetical protein ABSB57_03900 [Dehalococcoidia bacterium]
MQQYIVRRAFLNVLVIFMVITLVFLALRVTPGDFVLQQAASQIPGHSLQEAIDIRRHDLGLDRPILKQYWEFVSGLFRGDLGHSFLVWTLSPPSGYGWPGPTTATSGPRPSSETHS